MWSQYCEEILLGLMLVLCALLLVIRAQQKGRHILQSENIELKEKVVYFMDEHVRQKAAIDQLMEDKINLKSEQQNLEDNIGKAVQLLKGSGAFWDGN